MGTALNIQAPNRDELAADIRHHLPAMYLFHDSPEWLPMEIFGRTFYIPPNLPDQRLVAHPVFRLKNLETGADLGPLMAKADGRLACRDIYGIHRHPRTNAPERVGLMTGQDAGAIVIYACENFGDQGVVWLRGDETDAQRIEKSRKLYGKWIRGWAEGERAARAEFVGKWTQNPAHKGQIPPPPTPTQRRAQELLDSQSISERGSEYICMIAYDWEGDSFETYQRHMKAAHNKIVTRKQDDDATAAPGQARTFSEAEIQELSNVGGEDPLASVGGEPIIPEQLRGEAVVAASRAAKEDDRPKRTRK